LVVPTTRKEESWKNKEKMDEPDLEDRKDQQDPDLVADNETILTITSVGLII
jgi:hypothetical protein